MGVLMRVLNFIFVIVNGVLGVINVTNGMEYNDLYAFWVGIFCLTVSLWNFLVVVNSNKREGI